MTNAHPAIPLRVVPASEFLQRRFRLWLAGRQPARPARLAIPHLHDFHHLAAVFELVSFIQNRTGELTALANEDKASGNLMRYAPPITNPRASRPATFSSDRQPMDKAADRPRFSDPWGLWNNDVTSREHDSRFWKIRDCPYVALDLIFHSSAFHLVRRTGVGESTNRCLAIIDSGHGPQCSAAF